MKQMRLSKKVCVVCGKADQVGYNLSHSQRSTKRVVRPNLQKNKGRVICAACLRTERKKSK